MRKIGSGLAAVNAYLAIAVPSQAQVTASGANVFAGATAVLITGRSFSPDEETASGVLSPGQSFVDAAATAMNQDGRGNRAYAHEDVFANFVSPTSGVVNFSGSSTSLSTSAATIAEAYNSGSSFNFDFTINSSYLFNMNYSYSETDSYYYDNYYQLINTSGGAPLFSDSPLSGTYDTPATGRRSILLGPGSYEFGITTSLGDLSAVQGSDYGAGAHTEQYAFSLIAAAVPEPATWGLMIVGFGLVGASLRRRRTGVAASVALA